MIKNFVEELTWRGMIHDVMPGAEEHLMESMRSAYVGFDPTADSNDTVMTFLFMMDPTTALF